MEIDIFSMANSQFRVHLTIVVVNNLCPYIINNGCINVDQHK